MKGLKILTAFSAILWCFNIQAASHNTLACSAPSVRTELFFANGMFTSNKEAQRSAKNLQKIYEERVEGGYIAKEEGVKFKVSTNANENFFIQIGEVITQRYLSFVADRVDMVTLKPLREDKQIAFVDSFTQAKDTFLRVTDADLQNQVSTYKDALSKGKRIVIVSHSQGNLYTNPAVRLILNDNPEYAGSISTIGVANPDSTVANNGTNITLTTDLLMTAIGQGGTITNSSTSGVSHSFDKNYLDGDKTRDAIINALNNALTDTVFPTAIVEDDVITVALTWGNQPDMDLHIREPGGAHVYYDAPRGVVGVLSRDDTNGRGPEFYRADCSNLQLGKYLIGVTYFSGNGASRGVVKIKAANASKTLITTIPVASEGLNDFSHPNIGFITIGKDETGRFTFKITKL